MPLHALKTVKTMRIGLRLVVGVNVAVALADDSGQLAKVVGDADTRREGELVDSAGGVRFKSRTYHDVLRNCCLPFATTGSSGGLDVFSAAVREQPLGPLRLTDGRMAPHGGVRTRREVSSTS